MTATPHPSVIPAEQSRVVRRARWLLGATIGWNSIEAVVAVGAGISAGSIALVGFGLDSLVEVFAALVATWQLHDGDDAHREARALRFIALSFFAVAAFVVAESVRDLITDHHASESSVGLLLAAVSLGVMPGLGLAKRRIANRLESATLRAESAETFLCASLSAVLLAGLAINAATGWWWADTAAALIIAALAIREGREAWHGDTCTTRHPHTPPELAP